MNNLAEEIFFSTATQEERHAYLVTLSQEERNLCLQDCVNWERTKLARACLVAGATINNWHQECSSAKIARLGLEFGYVPTDEHILTCSHEAFEIVFPYATVYNKKLMLKCCHYYTPGVQICLTNGVIPNIKHYRASANKSNLLELFGVNIDNLLTDAKFAAYYLYDKADQIDILDHVINVGNVSRCQSLYSKYSKNYDVISRLVNAGCRIYWPDFEYICRIGSANIVNLLIPIISRTETFICGYKAAVRSSNDEIVELLKGWVPSYLEIEFSDYSDSSEYTEEY